MSGRSQSCGSRLCNSCAKADSQVATEALKPVHIQSKLVETNKAADHADINCYTKPEQQYLVCVAVRTHM